MATSKETTPKKTAARKAAPRSPRKKSAVVKESVREQIARKAYELYEQSGRVDGRDIEHWLEAEKILTKKKK